MTLEEKKALLRRYSDAYYKGEPLVSDLIFDELFDEVRREELLQAKQEQLFTDQVNAPTPTTQMRNHGEPMVSLMTQTDTSFDAFLRFVRVFQKPHSQLSAANMVAQYKMDGLGLNLQYEEGVLARVLTRGDGKTGEDVTHCLPFFANEIPLKLSGVSDPLLEIRGEGVLSIENFRYLNLELEASGLPTYSNPRNAVAGLVRTKEIQKLPKVQLDFFPYSLGLCSGYPDQTLFTPSSETGFLQFLEAKGFNIRPWFSCNYVVDVEQLSKENPGPYGFYESARSERIMVPYLVDGVVYKFEDFWKQVAIGWHTRYPRWAMAQKFEPTAKTSILVGVTFEVGRTGKITPVGEVEPVEIDGVYVSRATLHNVFDIRRRNVRIGDEVTVYRSGDVIPEIGYHSRSLKRLPYRPNIRMPVRCLVCNSVLQRKKGEVNYYCVGPFCHAKLHAQLCHFVGKQGLDIKGIGPDLLWHLVENRQVSSYADLFSLDLNEKLTKEMNLAKTKEDWRFVSALGIRYVGQETAKKLCAHIPFEELPTQTLEQLCQVPGVDTKTANSVVEYFANDGHRKSWEFMKWWEGVSFKSTYGNKSGRLSNMIIILTGSFDNPKRSQLEAFIEQQGGKVAKEVTSNTSLIIVGKDPTPRKMDEARCLNKPYLSAFDFQQKYM